MSDVTVLPASDGSLSRLPDLRIPSWSTILRNIWAPDGTTQALATNQVTGQPNEGEGMGITLSRIVLIVLGLLLIAAGLYSFDRTRELVVQAGRAAGAAAA